MLSCIWQYPLHPFSTALSIPEYQKRKKRHLQIDVALWCYKWIAVGWVMDHRLGWAMELTHICLEFNLICLEFNFVFTISPPCKLYIKKVIQRVFKHMIEWWKYSNFRGYCLLRGSPIALNFQPISKIWWGHVLTRNISVYLLIVLIIISFIKVNFPSLKHVDDIPTLDSPRKKSGSITCSNNDIQGDDDQMIRN